jgi:hypothetical protein
MTAQSGFWKETNEAGTLSGAALRGPPWLEKLEGAVDRAFDKLSFHSEKLPICCEAGVPSGRIVLFRNVLLGGPSLRDKMDVCAVLPDEESSDGLG